MKPRLRAALLPVLGLLLATAGPVAATHDERDTPHPDQVLEALERAVNNRNVEAAFRQFADTATVEADGVTSDRGSIRRWLQRQVEADVHVHLSGYQGEGEQVTWKGEIGQGAWYQAGAAPLEVTGNAVVREGRIESLAYTVVRRDAAELGAAATWELGRARQASFWAPWLPWIPLALGSGLVVGFGMLLRSRQPARTTTGASGRLIRHLDRWSAERRRSTPSPHRAGYR